MTCLFESFPSQGREGCCETHETLDSVSCFNGKPVLRRHLVFKMGPNWDISRFKVGRFILDRCAAMSVTLQSVSWVLPGLVFRVPFKVDRWKESGTGPLATILVTVLGECINPFEALVFELHMCSV